MSEQELEQYNLESIDYEESNVDLDTIADTYIDIIQKFLIPFNVGDITIDEYEGDEGELILDITGSDLAVLIGRHGRTLEAIQFLASLITRHKIESRYPVTIDIEGYKNRQKQKIEAIAKSAAKRAISKNIKVSLKPMSPYERRIVHMILKEDTRIETYSELEGKDRHIVISPI